MGCERNPQSVQGTFCRYYLMESCSALINAGVVPHLNDVAGPVGTAQAITQAASAGLQSGFGDAVNNILLMMIIITVNLGIVNLLPLPALDGGRLLFLIVEGIRRKPVNPKYEGWVHAAGFFLLMAFMLLITFNDIVRLVTGQGLGA